MARKLKIWNGRGHGKNYQKGHIYVAAYTQKQAAELVSKACFGEDCPNHISTNEIREYYSDCWSNPMKGIEPTEPCVYASKKYGDKPERII